MRRLTLLALVPALASAPFAGTARAKINQSKFLSAGQQTKVNKAIAGANIRDNDSARENIACMASDREVGLHLPVQLKESDLVPLPVSTLDDVIAHFQRIDRNGLSVARLPIADESRLVRAYRLFLIRATGSKAMTWLENALNYCFPKSLILYAEKRGKRPVPAW